MIEPALYLIPTTIGDVEIDRVIPRYNLAVMATSFPEEGGQDD